MSRNKQISIELDDDLRLDLIAEATTQKISMKAVIAKACEHYISSVGHKSQIVSVDTLQFRTDTSPK